MASPSCRGLTTYTPRTPNRIPYRGISPPIRIRFVNPIVPLFAKEAVLAALIGAVGTQPKLVVAMLAGLVDDGELPDALEPWLGFGGLAQRLEQPA